MAFSSPPDFLHTLSNSPSKHQRFAKITLYRKPEWRPSMSSISLTGLVSWRGKGWFSTSVTALASSPTMVWTGGMEAWPPLLFAWNSMFVRPFSAIPMRAHSRETPGNTFSTTAPPSSTTIAGEMPFCSNQSTMDGQLGPLISSCPEKAK